jgi:hypothetical protein
VGRIPGLGLFLLRIVGRRGWLYLREGQMITLYDSRKPLKCSEFKNRQIGCLVTGPFQHHGLPGKPMCADLHYDAVTVSTMGAGSIKLIHQLNLSIEDATVRIITHLSDVIEELTEHRDRLANELFRLKDEPAIDINNLRIEDKIKEQQC